MIEFSTPEGGLAIWSSFDKKIDLIKMFEDAIKKGVYIDNENFYKNESFNTNALRIGFATLEESEMLEALATLKKVLYK